MNLSGKQKSQLLISLIEEKSTEVLKHLSEESATILTSTLDDVPSIDEEEMGDFLTLVLESISEKEFEGSSAENDNEFEFDENDESIEENKEEITAETQQVSIQKEENPYPENYRSLEKIASHLSLQENQMVAFFFNYAEEEFADAVKEYMSDEKVAAYQKCRVEVTPMSEKIFKRLFDMVVLKTAEEIEEEKKQAETIQDQETEAESFDF